MKRKIQWSLLLKRTVNKWLKNFLSCKQVTPHDHLLNIQHNRTLICLWNLESERIGAVHTIIKLRSGNTVTVLNMSRFALSSSTPWTMYFILLFSWHNSSFHFMLAPLVPFPFHSQCISVCLLTPLKEIVIICFIFACWINLFISHYHLSLPTSCYVSALSCFHITSQISAFHFIFGNYEKKFKKNLSLRGQPIAQLKRAGLSCQGRDTSLLHVCLSSHLVLSFSEMQKEYQWLPATNKWRHCCLINVSFWL